MKECTLTYSNRSLRIKNDCTSCRGKYRHGDTMKFADTFPSRMCPFLYHSCLPYVITLASGGWFKWSQDKNVVDTQCPCPGGVQVQVKRTIAKHGIEISATVTNNSQVCSRCHAIGDTFKLFPEEDRHCMHMFHTVFDQMVVPDSGNKTHRICVSPDARVEAEIGKVSKKKSRSGESKQHNSFSVCDFNNGCAYFRKKGITFNAKQLYGEHMPMDAFYLIYPYYLSLLYDGKREDGAYFSNIRYISDEKEYFWNIAPEKYVLTSLLNLGDRLFRAIRFPYDFVNKKVVLTKTDFPIKTKPRKNASDAFVLDHYKNYIERKLFCPAAFYHLYLFFSSDKKDSLKVVCPSVISQVQVSFNSQNNGNK